MSTEYVVTVRTADPRVIARITLQTYADGSLDYATVGLIRGRYPEGLRIAMVIVQGDRARGAFCLDAPGRRGVALWAGSTVIDLADGADAALRAWFMALPEPLQAIHGMQPVEAAAA